jgi:hypothetical protein
MARRLRSLTFVASLCTAIATLAGSPPDHALAPAWSALAEMKFEIAARQFAAFTDDPQLGAEARLGHALGLLNSPPKTAAKISRARAALETVLAPRPPAVAPPPELAAAAHRPFLVPIAAAGKNFGLILDQLYANQNNRIIPMLNPVPTFDPAPDAIFLRDLRGYWSFRTPDFLSGLALMREVGRFFPHGFEQLDLDDALGRFLLGEALMTLESNRLAHLVKTRADFRIGFFPLAPPTANHPRYGRFTHGPEIETARFYTDTFALHRQGAQQALALDFLRFATSRDGNRRFAKNSGMLPAVIGVETPPNLAPFTPDLTSGVAPKGINLHWGGGNSGTEKRHVTETHFHTLFATVGGVEAYVRTLEREYEAAIRRDFEVRLRQHRLQLGFNDAALEGHACTGVASDRLHELIQAQHDRAATAAYIEHELALRPPP